MGSGTMLLTAAIFFLLVAIVAAVFTFVVKIAVVMPILYVMSGVSFLAFLWAGLTYMRERRRGERR
jgi:hypothetical protein